jgi:hypothetical protein
MWQEGQKPLFFGSTAGWDMNLSSIERHIYFSKISETGLQACKNGFSSDLNP